MTQDELAKARAELSSINRTIEQLHLTHQALAVQIAIATCPYEVGERTTVKGTSFLGRQCQISKIIPGRWGQEWQVIAYLINKNGKISEMHTKWSEADEVNR